MKYFFLFFFSLSALAQVKPENKQLILVITPSWESTHAHIYRFGRQENGEWKLATGDPVPGVVGRSGLGWGIGLHSEKDISPKNPLKIEGDGKAPAGIFTIGQAFGYDKPSSQIRLPSLALTPSTECVDDVKSRHYNEILERTSVSAPDWESSEKMRRKDELYRVGLVINHNIPPKKGKGSCIFLHVWNGPDSSTAGCTATHDYHIRIIQNWLDTDKLPLFIQLPWNEYLRLKKDWNLPEIERPLLTF